MMKLFTPLVFAISHIQEYSCKLSKKIIDANTRSLLKRIELNDASSEVSAQ